MRKSKNRWWNAVDLPTVPLTKELFEKFFNDYYEEPPEYLYFTRKATKLEWTWYKIKEFCIGLYQDITMKRIIVIENRFSKTLCAILNIPALTLYHLILLGCYKDRYETLLHETTHFYAFRTNKWYILNRIWYFFKKRLDKLKYMCYNIFK